MICIEGHEDYVRLLKRNASALPEAGRIHIVNEMVGTGRFAGTLIGDGTTASLQPANQSQSAKPLDIILSQLSFSLKDVILIKLDTDGYDADVIMSAQNTISAAEPVLFWENYFENQSQLRNLEQMYDNIKTHGYNHLWVFDNFGGLILEQCSLEELKKLNKYIKNQNDDGSSRTMWYTDVLATTSRRFTIASDAISEFRRAYNL